MNFSHVFFKETRISRNCSASLKYQGVMRAYRKRKILLRNVYFDGILTEEILKYQNQVYACKKHNRKVNNMKKILAIALALCMVFALCAAASAEWTPDGPVTLIVAY